MSTATRWTMPPSNAPARTQSSKRIMMTCSACRSEVNVSCTRPQAYRGHRHLAGRPCGSADRRVVEPQNQHVAVDSVGGQPVAGPRARSNEDVETAIGVAQDLLAGEALAIDRVADQLALRIVERQRPES